MGGKVLTNGYTYNDVTGKIDISEVTGDVNIIASALRDTSNISFGNAKKVGVGSRETVEIDQSYRVRIFEFTPTETGIYEFWSEDDDAAICETDPYAYLYDGVTDLDLDNLLVEAYISSKDAWSVFDKNDTVMPLAYCDDAWGFYTRKSEDEYYEEIYNNFKPSVQGYNFYMRYNCEANHKYYLVIRTYTSDYIQTFENIRVGKVK